MSLPQPVPPSWKDLGKSSNDLLGKDFPISGVNLEVKTATPSNVLFKVGGVRDTKSTLIAGDIEAKFFNKPHGLTFTQTWTTSNILKTQVEIDNQIAKGVKLELATALTPDTGAKSALFTTTYKQPGLHTRAFLDIFKGPTFTADTVIGRDGFLVGAEASYNVTEGKVTKYATAVGYSAPEYAVALHGLGNLSTFAASYYHRVNPDVEAGAKAVYDTRASPKGNVALEVGAKVYLDAAGFFKVKINNTGILALGKSCILKKVSHAWMLI
ncbi:voltage-dependent ion-selective channel [Earliella scabrosa]|nr:voltage-dependent ion-selective channel [Earliella scabrosa]